VAEELTREQLARRLQIAEHDLALARSMWNAEVERAAQLRMAGVRHVGRQRSEDQKYEAEVAEINARFQRRIDAISGDRDGGPIPAS
jgi:hypothetical protein